MECTGESLLHRELQRFPIFSIILILKIRTVIALGSESVADHNGFSHSLIGCIHHMIDHETVADLELSKPKNICFLRSFLESRIPGKPLWIRNCEILGDSQIYSFFTVT